MLQATESNPGLNHLCHFLGLSLDTPDEHLTETCCNNYFHCFRSICFCFIFTY